MQCPTLLLSASTHTVTCKKKSWKTLTLIKHRVRSRKKIRDNVYISLIFKMTVTDYFLDNKQVDLEKKYVHLYEDIVCIFMRLETKISIVPQLQ